MEKNILVIHGAHSSSTVFNHLVSSLPKNANFIPIDYDVKDGFFFNLEMMIDKVDKKKSYHVIGHSLGGIFGIHLTRHLNIKKGVSIATPFSGASIADWARYMMPHYALFRDVHTKAFPIEQAKDIHIAIPWLQIVATKGNVPWLRTPNDGVVTVASQTSRRDVDYLHLDETHHEIIQSENTIEAVKNFIFSS
jgi:pimeloyl-ACP methyl ester carboxylesterase